MLQAFDMSNEAMADAKDRLDSKKYAEAQAAFTSALGMAANADQRGEARRGVTEALLESGDCERSRKLAEETLEDYKELGECFPEAVGGLLCNVKPKTNFPCSITPVA